MYVIGVNNCSFIRVCMDKDKVTKVQTNCFLDESTLFYDYEEIKWCLEYIKTKHCSIAFSDIDLISEIINRKNKTKENLESYVNKLQLFQLEATPIKQ